MSQFKQLYLPGYFLSVERGDNCVLVDNKIGIIRNIVCETGNSEKFLVLEYFNDVFNFFETPLNSSDLRIFCVSHLSEQISFKKAFCVTCKCVLMPFKNSYLAIPLIHTFGIDADHC